MTFTPRFPNAPLSYDHNNEAAFRRMVLAALADASSPLITTGAIDLEAILPPAAEGDTLIYTNNSWIADTRFLVDMEFLNDIIWYNTNTDEIQHSLFQMDLALAENQATSGGGTGGGTSGQLTDLGGGNFMGATDFSEFATGVGLPTGISALYSGDAPTTFEIVDAGGEIGKYLKMTGHANGANGFAYVIDSFAGVGTQYVEMLARIWISTVINGRDFIGPMCGLGGTTAANWTGVGAMVNASSTSDYNVRAWSRTGTQAAVDSSITEAEGIWVWVRWRWSQEPGNYIRVKAWDGALEAEPASWNIDAGTGLTSNGSTDGIGFGMRPFNTNTNEQRIAYLAFSTDPVGSPPPTSTQAPAVYLTLRNRAATMSGLMISPEVVADITTGSSSALLRLARFEDETSFESLELSTLSAAGAAEDALTQLKGGDGSYRPFYFRWDATDGFEILSPDDVGGPLFTFNMDVVAEGTLDVDGDVTLTLGDLIVTTGDVTLTAGNLVVTAGRILAPNGTAALPSYGFSGDLDTGIYGAAAQVSVSVGSAERARFTTLTELLGASDEILRLVHSSATGSPQLTFYQTTTLRAHAQWDDSLTALRFSSLEASSNVYFYIADAGGVQRAALRLNVIGPVAHFNADNQTISEVIRLGASINGSPYISFYQVGTQRALIQFSDTGPTLVFQNTEAGFYQFNTTSGGSLFHIRQNTAPHVFVNAGSDEMFRLNHTSATGSPYISVFQNGTRRYYIQYFDGGVLHFENEFHGGAIRFYIEDSVGTDVNVFQLKTVAPLVQINASAVAVDELLRVTGSGTGGPQISIYQSATQRGYLGFDNTAGALVLNAVTAAHDVLLYAANTLRVTVDGATGGLFVHSAVGIDILPGSDIDADLITVQVTGTPRFWWDESANLFVLTHGLGVNGDLSVVGVSQHSIGGSISIDGAGTGTVLLAGSSGTLAFFGAAGSTKQTLTGARDNPEGALANLITLLAGHGLLTDSTTAS